MADRMRRWRNKANALKSDVHALYLALLDPRTPWYAKLVAVCVVAYAISPLDLIPDPIPVLGYLDDVVLLPLGILLVRRLIPPEVLNDCRAQAAAGARRSSLLPWLGAAVIGLLWLACLALMIYATWRYFS